MKRPDWNDLFPSHEEILAMTPEKLKNTGHTARQYVATLAFGISGIGNLLACTASTGESGLSEDAVTSAGWLLENLGALIGNLSDMESAATWRRNEIQRGGV
ncbi:hypothetical protein D3C84_747060 [compost metagenome]